MPDAVLAVDFGTSNSAAACIVDGAVKRLQIEDSADTLPTSVFFETGREDMLIGEAANFALIDRADGRYMRALKSVLGTALFHESRLLGGKRQTLADVVTAFLATLKERAEALEGCSFRRVVSGRPVHFHSANAGRDLQAEIDLRNCYHAAGFEEVHFIFEPEAAARACHRVGSAGSLGLIVDIGGGTSDFSVFDVSDGYPRISSSHGIRLGGTDFDQRISMSHVMPEFGHGGQLRRTFGSGLLPVPNAIYLDLSTWAKIPFLYARETERKVDDLIQHAVEPRKMERLGKVIGDHLGHDVAFAVERGKILANDATIGQRIDLSFVETGLAPEVDQSSMNKALAAFTDQLGDALSETLRLAGVGQDKVGAAILVGGSSLMTLVPEAVGRICPKAEIFQSDPFTAVVDGLALASLEGDKANGG